MTSDAVRHELSRIAALIEVLECSYPTPEDEVEDIRWLKEQRRHLGALLDMRRVQRGKRLVSLEVWRNGRPGRAAATAA